MKTFLRLAVSIAAMVCGPGWAQAERPVDVPSEMRAEIDGRVVPLPLMRSVFDARIDGDLATVTVEQTFTNPGTRPLNATYLFPLSEKAAVFAMTMRTEAETIEARIAKRGKARRDFKRAKAEGRNAALLEQHRPNMFTQEVANLMPGAPITVTLRYTEAVSKIDGAYELVLPLVVGPRYQPEAPAPELAEPAAEDTEPGSEAASGQWILGPAPDYPAVAGLEIPEFVDPERVSISVDLDAGVRIASAASATHSLNRVEEGPDHWRLALAEGKTIDNRDFVLRYRLNGDGTHAGLLARHDERGGFFSLMIEPPALEDARDVAPREMVFVLDCSGSMSGLPIDASKAFVRKALQRLRPDDSFRIIRFSDRATEFSSQPLPATRANVLRGLTYLNGLSGGGGTVMSSGIVQALSGTPHHGRRRIVVFLTDGYIGNEEDVLRLINRDIGAARLYAFGVGTGVNRWLLEEMGRTGGGFTRFMDPTESIEQVAGELADRLQAPVLTDIEIDWAGLAPSGLSVDRIPDLFAGQPLRLLGRYDTPGRYTVRVRGNAGGRSAEMPIDIDLPADGGGGEGIALAWARSAVAKEMRRLTMPPRMPGRAAPLEVEERVTELGLTYALVTQWTSFLAESTRVVNASPETAAAAAVPLPKVKGVSSKAYGHRAPEPGEWAVVIASILALAGFWWRARRRRHPEPGGRSWA